MDFVALLEEELSEVGAVLPRNAGYECLLHALCCPGPSMGSSDVLDISQMAQFIEDEITAPGSVPF